jgi:predicted permease
MASTTTGTYARPSTATLLRTRALAVASAAVANAALWVIEVPLLGLHLDIRFGSGAAQTIALGFVIGATLSASLVGWALLAVLERRTASARTIWTAVAAVALIASLSLPLYAGIAGSTKVGLAAMHLAAAAILIPTLRATSAPRNI